MTTGLWSEVSIIKNTDKEHHIYQGTNYNRQQLPFICTNKMAIRLVGRTSPRAVAIATLSHTIEKKCPMDHLLVLWANKGL
jgi:hypothetical protein